MKHFRDDKGFTLVELAVVMVIIGLLIGGILKGQEMIENARVNATITQAKAVIAASSTFQDMYDALPGDMLTASTRLPATGAAQINGNGDNHLVAGPFTVPGGENISFFPHLRAADLLAGSLSGANATFTTSYGLSADIRGVELTIGEQLAAAAVGISAVNTSGRFITIAYRATATQAGLTPLQAGRIDRKIDDGIPTTGSVLANVAACGTATGYLENLEQVLCSVAIRMN